MKRAVIVGCGNIAAVHAAVLTAQKDTELVGVADIHFEKAQDYAERFHTKPYASLEEIMKKLLIYGSMFTKMRRKWVGRLKPPLIWHYMKNLTIDMILHWTG